MCAQNMMLATKSLGLDSCPIGLAKYVERTELYATLNIPVSEKVHIALIIGYGDELPELHTRKHDNAFFIE
jgi:nitroreductase